MHQLNRLVFFFFQCRVGSKVKLKVGGDFYYYAEISSPKPDLLLIAGGVGINPLISAMRHAEDLNNGSNGISLHFGRLMILYSARTQDELIFQVYNEFLVTFIHVNMYFHITDNTTKV